MTEVLDDSKNELPRFIWAVWRAIAPTLQSAIEGQTNTTVWIEPESVASQQWMKPLAGKPVMYTLAQDESYITIHMPGGFYIIRLLWAGGDSGGWASAAVEVGCVIALCYLATTLFPPPRKYMDRIRAGSVLIAERLRHEVEDLGKVLNLTCKVGGVQKKVSTRADDPPQLRNDETSDSEDDKSLRYVRNRRRQARVKRGISAVIPDDQKDKEESTRMRDRHTLTTSAAALLQHDITLAMHEELWFSPFGINATLSHPGVVKAMQ